MTLQSQAERLALGANQNYGAEVAIVVQRSADAHPIAEVNPEMRAESASLAKLAIAYASLERLRIGEVDKTEPLAVRKSLVRGGTGILQHYPDGYELSFANALVLMLRESDNTAANLLLERLDGSILVNGTLAGVDIMSTGLVSRAEDNLYESTTARPHDILAIVERIRSHRLGTIALEALRTSHFRWGLRYALGGKPAMPTPKEERSAKLRRAILTKLPSKHARDRYLREHLSGPRTPAGATKEGSQDDTQNEAGTFFRGRGDVNIVVMSKNWGSHVYPRDHPSKTALLRPFGKQIDYHT